MSERNLYTGWRSSQTALRVDSVQHPDGTRLADVRLYRLAGGGVLEPCSAGVTIFADELPAVLAALQEAADEFAWAVA